MIFLLIIIFVDQQPKFSFVWNVISENQLRNIIYSLVSLYRGLFLMGGMV